jgi:hypothetical protein
LGADPPTKRLEQLRTPLIPCSLAKSNYSDKFCKQKYAIISICARSSELSITHIFGHSRIARGRGWQEFLRAVLLVWAGFDIA